MPCQVVLCDLVRLPQFARQLGCASAWVVQLLLISLQSRVKTRDVVCAASFVQLTMLTQTAACCIKYDMRSSCT